MSAVPDQGVDPPAPDPTKDWEGSWRPYDLAKEFVIALIVVSLLTLGLAIAFGSPDEQPLTISRWARAAPADFLTTSVSELNGTSEIAQYGPPYNDTPGAAQKVGPVSLQQIPGVRIPVNPAQDFVLGPLAIEAREDPQLALSLSQYRNAGTQQQNAWLDAYSKSLASAQFGTGGQAVLVPSGDYGPVGTMMNDLLKMASSGSLDGALLANTQFYQTDYTKPLLFMSGGSYFESLAEKEHLLGGQWGMMNETGSYPGQAWLWLYTFWYQVQPFRDSGNADALVWVLMGILSLAFILLPFVPGLRSLPKHLGVHRKG